MYMSLMTTKTTKTILIASLIVALILPFSVMSLVDAASSDGSANDKAKEPGAPTDAQMQKMLKLTPKEKTPLTAEEKNRNYPPPGNHSNSGISTQGTGHIGFGTGLDKNTSSQGGVYAKIEVHDGGIILKDGTYLYAPTILPADNSSVEIVTFYADEGWWTGMKEHVVLFNWATESYDWSNDFVIDSDFMDNHTIRVDSSDYYYITTYVYNNYTYVFIFDVTNWQWNVWDIIYGSGPISDGWVVWEEYYFNGDCPTTLPEIKIRGILIYDGYWQPATSSYASEHDDGSICGINSATFQSEFDEWSVDD